MDILDPTVGKIVIKYAQLIIVKHAKQDSPTNAMLAMTDIH